MTQANEKARTLQAKLDQVESSLSQSKVINGELKETNADMREAIDRLKTENKKLNKDLVKERSRAEQALRNSNLSSANDGAVKALKDRINDLKNEIELLNNQNAKLLMALKEANQNNSSREGAHVGQGHFGGQGDYELRNKIDELSRRLDETEAENRRLKQNGPTNNGHAGYSSAFDSRKEHITRLEAENGSLKRGNVKVTQI